MLDRIRDGLAAVEPRLPRTEGWYDAALAGLADAGRRGRPGAVQNGRMTSYLRNTFLVLGAADLGRARGRARRLAGAAAERAS